MKKLLLLFSILALNACELFAQHEFAPIGATWYFDVGHESYPYPTWAIMQVKCEKDTVVNGINCKKISQKIMGMEEDGSDAYNLFNLYWYQNGDTIFSYNYLFDRFTPLYIFNMQIGDTFRVPIFHTYGNSYLSADDDSTFTLVVDSVSMVQYDTTWAKSYFMHPVIHFGTDFAFSWNRLYPQDSSGLQYNEVMGDNHYSGLYPDCIYGCASLTAYDPSDHNWGISALRCYHDSFTFIEYVDSCFVPKNFSSVKELSSLLNNKIYPNPANNTIYLDNYILENFKAISVYNVNGTLVKQYDNMVSSIDVSNASPGILILKLIDKRGNIYYEKIIIAH